MAREVQVRYRDGRGAFSGQYEGKQSQVVTGRSVDQLAALMGNTPGVIRHHDARLLGDAHGPRAAAGEATPYAVALDVPGGKPDRPSGRTAAVGSRSKSFFPCTACPAPTLSALVR
jgi:hypothetical protein